MLTSGPEEVRILASSMNMRLWRRMEFPDEKLGLTAWTRGYDQPERTFYVSIYQSLGASSFEGGLNIDSTEY